LVVVEQEQDLLLEEFQEQIQFFQQLQQQVEAVEEPEEVAV
jgi:hypothetical protein